MVRSGPLTSCPAGKGGYTYIDMWQMYGSLVEVPFSNHYSVVEYITKYQPQGRPLILSIYDLQLFIESRMKVEWNVNPC